MKKKEIMYRNVIIKVLRSRGISLRDCGNIFNLSPAGVLRIERAMSFELYKELVESNPDIAAIANAALRIVNENITAQKIAAIGKVALTVIEDNITDQSDTDSPVIKVKWVAKVQRVRNEPLKLPTDPESRKNAIRWMYLKSIAEGLGIEYGVKNVTLDNALTYLGNEAPKEVKSLDELLDYLVGQSL